MSYVINNTSGNVLLTLQDGSTDSSTGLNLIGRNYTGYGLLQNDNFIRLLENFADTTPPTTSLSAAGTITGTLWYDTGNQLLKVYDGTNFNVVSGRQASATAPTAKNIGDQWWDTVNLQLKSWTGAAWQLIGPTYTAAQGLSGTFATTIVDTTSRSHVVAATYTAGNLVSISSYDPAFTPATPITNFPAIINPGITVSNTESFIGTVTNTQLLNNLASTQFARSDINSSFAGDITVAGNVVLGYGNIHFTSNNNLVLHNHAYQGNVNFYVNSSQGNITTLSLSGVTGLATVYGDPTAPTGIATKNYVDNTYSNLNSAFTTVTNALNGDILAVQADYLSNIASVETAFTNTINAVQASINSNVTTLTNNTTANAQSQETEIIGLRANITSANAVIATLAPINSPVFVGKPTAPAAPELISYLNELSSLQYILQLTTPITVNAGDYITEISTSTFDVLSNLLCTTTQTSSNIAVAVVTGTITAGNTAMLMQTSNTITGSTTFNSQIYANSAIISTHIISSATSGTTLAFTGLGDLSSSIATTAYVDVSANILYGDYTGRIATSLNSAKSYTNAVTQFFANVYGPVFQSNTITGLLPQSVTPTTGDNSANIATTAFVNTSITTKQFNYNVATTGPGDASGGISSTNGYAGNNGDFWFQIG